MRATFPVAVHIFLMQEEQVLLLRRYHTGYEDGKYSVVAGHLEAGETVTQAAQREALEEVGIHIQPRDLRVVGVMQRKSNDERVDFFFECRQWQGEISNREPDKCDQLAWFSPGALPENVIPYVRRAIDNARRGTFFEEYGWGVAGATAKPTLYHRMRGLNRRLAANYARRAGMRGFVLLLTTTGRKSGLPRTTPLQYDEMDGVLYVASARGPRADWYRNLQAEPRVQVQVGERRFAALAEPINDPARVAGFLEQRRRNSALIRLVMWFEGLPPWASRPRLEAFARSKTIVALHPTSD